MSEETIASPLMRRLAFERLAAPGILDQRRLQRAPGRFVALSDAPIAERLMRRVEGMAQTPTPAAAGLLLAPGEGVARGGVQLHRRLGVAQSTSPAELGAGDLHAPNPGSFIGDRAARQAANATGVGEFIARAHTVTSTLSDGGRISSLVRRRVEGAPDGMPLIARTTGANRLLQRAPDTADSAARATQSSSLISVLAPSMTLGPRVLMRKAEPAAVSEVVRAARGGALPAAPPATSAANAHKSGAAREAGLAHKSGSTVASGLRAPPGLHAGHESHAAVASRAAHQPVATHVRPFIWRKSEAAESRVPPAVSISAAPVVSATAAPLVFRKVVAAPAAFSAATGTPSIASAIMKAPAATNVVARAAMPAEPVHGETPSSPTLAREPSLDLEWLTHQVSHRLARRLEIERDRLGVRPWRQSSF